jgi:hypothetical protein
MVAWSSQSLKAKGEESNLGFLLRPVFLQKYLGYSEHRCAGMARVPDVLFGPKRRERAEGSTRQTRSRDPNPALAKETEPSISSTEGSVSLSLSGEESSGEGQAHPVVEGPIILDDSPDEDEDEILSCVEASRSQEKTPEETEDQDLPPSPKKMEVERSEFAAFLEENP